MDKYYQCNKCGGSLAVNHDKAPCTLPVSYRTSGICGGSISNEITHSEYLNIKSLWRTAIRKKKIEKIIK
jgi:uncharacterized CHY-type Zn-finger protein